MNNGNLTQFEEQLEGLSSDCLNTEECSCKKCVISGKRIKWSGINFFIFLFTNNCQEKKSTNTSLTLKK